MTVVRGLSVVLAVLIVWAAVPLVAPTATAKERRLVVEMRSPNRFLPEELRVDPGDIVTIVVFNNDTQGHTFDLPAFSVELGTSGAPMQPGTNRTATFTTAGPGTVWYFCAIPGHATPRGDGSYTGMAGRLVVGQPAGGPDLTVVFVVIGVAAVIGVGIGLVLRSRRRVRKT